MSTSIPKPGNWYLGTQVRVEEIDPPAGASCEPTYAMSHRWGYPDNDGYETCGCGARRSRQVGKAFVSGAGGDPCEKHAITLVPEFWQRAAQRGRVEGWERGLKERYGSKNVERNWSGYDRPSYITDAPYEAEENRCWRLGIPYEPPDYQPRFVGTRIPTDRFVPRYEDVMRALWDGIPRTEFMVSDDVYWCDVEHSDGSMTTQFVAIPWQECRNRTAHAAEPGQIVRLGCPLRTRDGVTPREER